MRKKLPGTSGEVKLTRIKFPGSTGNFFIEENKAFGPSFYAYLGKGYVSANYKAKWVSTGCKGGEYTLKFESVIYFFQKDAFTDILGFGFAVEKFISPSLKLKGEKFSNWLTSGKPYNIVAYWKIYYDKEVELKQP